MRHLEKKEKHRCVLGQVGRETEDLQEGRKSGGWGDGKGEF
jgi:hypothetical protein